MRVTRVAEGNRSGFSNRRLKAAARLPADPRIRFLLQSDGDQDALLEVDENAEADIDGSEAEQLGLEQEGASNFVEHGHTWMAAGQSAATPAHFLDLQF